MRISHHAPLSEEKLHLSSQRTVQDLPQLITFLKSLSEEQFSHYVSKAHHNIADWIFEGYGNEKLSRKARKIHDKQKMISLLEKALRKETKRVGLQHKQTRLQRIKLPKSKKKILAQLENIDNHLNILTAPNANSSA